MCETVETQGTPIIEELPSVPFPPAEPQPEAQCSPEAFSQPEQPQEPLPERQTVPGPTPVSKGSKRLPYWILCILFVIGLVFFLGVRDNSGPSTDPNMPWFAVSDGVLYFDSSLYTGPAELTVPDAIGGETVTELSQGCFSQCARLTTIRLPQTLQVIGNGAFYGCTSLRGVYIPAQVVSIGSEAFAQCSKLESLVIPYTVQRIGEAAFESCGNLLYIFYSGPEEAWRSLYAEPIAPKTFIFTPDGSFRHTTLS